MEKVFKKLEKNKNGGLGFVCTLVGYINANKHWKTGIWLVQEPMK